jgi:hypothetical protein
MPPEFAFPLYPLRTEKRDDETMVFDPIRRKWIKLTPEEFVRQSLIAFLIRDRAVYPGRLAVEQEVRYNQLRKRFDLLLYDLNGAPHLLCEVKSPEVELSAETIRQAFRYNADLQAPYVLITNGWAMYLFKRDEKGDFHPVEDDWIPEN